MIITESLLVAVITVAATFGAALSAQAGNQPLVIAKSPQNAALLASRAAYLEAHQNCCALPSARANPATAQNGPAGRARQEHALLPTVHASAKRIPNSAGRRRRPEQLSQSERSTGGER